MDGRQGDRTSELREEIIRLGPWHIDVQVTPEISTKAFLEAPEGTYPSSGPRDPTKVSFVDPREGFVNLLQTIYPKGLEGRTFLDCACNCGGYSFWAKELGASGCFGFDVHEHWIDQARFLMENRVWPSDGIRFDVADLYDLPKLGLEPFDITLFQGIFYHLPDPITGLKAAADLTREVLILDTATRNGFPDGMLSISEEGRDYVMTGVYGLNWFPTGPKVLTRILNWMGFTETKILRFIPNHRKDRPDIGRLRMIASRKEGLLENIVPELGQQQPGLDFGQPGARRGKENEGPHGEPWKLHEALLSQNEDLRRRLQGARQRNKKLHERVERMEKRIETLRDR